MTAVSSDFADPLSWQVVRAGRLLWRVRVGVDVAKLRPVLERPDDYLARREFQFKSSRVVTVARVPDLAPPTPPLVLRRLNYGKALHRVRDWFRASRARRSFATGLRLVHCGVATPRPVAVAEARRCRWPLGAYLVTEEIVGATTLTRFLAGDIRLGIETINRLADLLAHLHDQGFSHRDLKPTNILLDPQQNVYLIDLDGVRSHGLVTERRVVLDLARLARGLNRYPSLVRISGWKFIRRYCSQRGLEWNPRRLGKRVAVEVEQSFPCI